MKFGIDNREFQFDVVLVNADGEVFPFKKSAIKYLELTDDLFSPFHSGQLIVDNTQEIIEAGSSGVKSSNGYMFRADGRDLCLITIYPDTNQGNSDIHQQESNLEKHLALQFVFSLYDETENIDPLGQFKQKHFALIDFRESLLKEINLNFSSNNIPEVSGNINSGRKERSGYTGDIIKNILLETFSISSKGNTFENMFPPEKFDIGKNRIQYTSPPYFKAWDDLMYVLGFHSSQEKDDGCILQCERQLSTQSKTNEFTLLPLHKYFEFGVSNAAEYCLESIFLGKVEEISSQLSRVRNKLILPFIPDYCSSANFKFLNPTPHITNSDWNNGIISGYRPDEKTFQFSAVKMEDIRNEFNELYVKHFSRIVSSPTPNIVLNNIRKTNGNFKLDFCDHITATNEVLTSRMRTRLLNSLIFTNSLCQFTIPGYTHRSSGKFLDIFFLDENISGQSSDNNFTIKSEGRWFITRIKHIFNGDTYINNVDCVKPYFNENIQFNEDL